MEPSFAPCENLVFGRMSYKGFNPEIEVLFISVHHIYIYELYYKESWIIMFHRPYLGIPNDTENFAV